MIGMYFRCERITKMQYFRGFGYQYKHYYRSSDTNTSGLYSDWFHIKSASLYHCACCPSLHSTTMSTMSTERGWFWEKARLESCTQAETSATRSGWPSKKYQRETAGEKTCLRSGPPRSLSFVPLKVSLCCYRRRRIFERTLWNSCDIL